jgi:hypothetical protein
MPNGIVVSAGDIFEKAARRRGVGGVRAPPQVARGGSGAPSRAALAEEAETIAGKVVLPSGKRFELHPASFGKRSRRPEQGTIEKPVAGLLDSGTSNGPDRFEGATQQVVVTVTRTRRWHLAMKR